ncbi:MAG TPA: PEP-CTERM sorting domain-containing protein [Methylomirabilota bacterium]|nr:PEP-CTERM sorting domain-containing protein [Methylomirabilota bacterium]
MNMWKTSAVAVALLSGVSAFAQAPQVVYDNSRIYSDKTFSISGDTLEVGDELRFSPGGPGVITNAKFEYYLPTGSGNETVAFSLRQIVDGQVGDVLFQTAPFSITSGATPFSVEIPDIFAVYTNPNVLMSLRFGGLEGAETAGLLFYLGPDTGSSLNDFWVAGPSGWARASVPDASGNFGFQVTAIVPEPGTWALMIGGLGFLGALGLRRRKA